MWLLSSGNDSLTVSVTYAIPFDHLIFVRTSDTTSGFDASLSFTVDAEDSVTGVNSHRFVAKRFDAATYEDTRAKSKSAEDFVTLTLPRSVYHIKAELRDDSQKITYFNGAFTKDLRYPDSSGIVSVIFLDSLSRARYYPVMRNDVAPFPGWICFLIVASRVTAAHPVVSISTTKGVGIGRSVSAVRIDGRPAIFSDSNRVYVSLVPDSSRAAYLGELNIDTLVEGRYKLNIRTKDGSRTFLFHYLWLDKPMTLRNFNLAFSLLKYIVPDSIYSELNSGNEAERKEKFDSFWKRRDPTPSTAFNELEAVYYERADQAYKKFATFMNPNGAATDRGKAYILYGRPDSVKREFKSDGTYEIWNYPNLKKSLVFKEQNFGEFKLYKTEKL